MYPEHGETPGTLLDHIQSALRFAKEGGRRIAVYNSQLDELIRTESDILRRLKEAVRRETLEVWYQPIALLADGEYSAAEALVRLSDGKGGYFSAGQVVALSEGNGIVEELGDYVLQRACLFMHSRGEALGLKRISVNLSVQQFLVGNSAEHLLELIHSTGVDPRLVTLDDFGVGYSSLNYLSNLPVDVIKIDRSPTREILISPKQAALLNSIVEMASINGLLVAEGVETQAEQQAIAGSGVHYIQGYYYAGPMPEEAVSRFLES